MTLDAYLKTNAIRPAAFAALIGVPASTVTRIIRGEREPRMDTVRKIMDATDGAVTFEDFMPKRTIQA